MEYFLKDGVTSIIVDDEDLEKIKDFPIEWKLISDGSKTFVGSYACSKGKSFKVSLSQFILGLGIDSNIDHLNNNYLDFRKSNLKEINYEISYASEKDSIQMLDLNYRIYPKEWHVKEDYVSRVLSKNNKVYNVLKVNGVIKGIISFFPVSKEVLDGLLDGTFNEEELTDHLLNYENDKKVCLYLISIIVDIFDDNKKEYSKRLIKNIPNQLRNIERMGVEIEEIGAIAISEDGDRITNSIGFKKTSKLKEFGKTYNVYRANLEDIIDSIRV